MSSKEARRPGLVQAAMDGKITNSEGARALGISIRQFRRLKLRYRKGGPPSLMHLNRGRPSGRRMPCRIRERIVALLRTTYAGFNDHHLTEKLREVEGLRISRELVRRIRRAAQIAPVRRRRPPKYRARRLREAREGALVLLDASAFAWFGPKGPVCTLVGAIDDATGAIVALHFRPHEDLHGYTVLLRRMALRRGLPVQLYGDRLGVFVRNDDRWSLEEELAGVRKPTQFGVMLGALAIGFIAAGSPQAKGRIERLWQTLQDRLVSELRLKCVANMQEGEQLLGAFLEDFNQRFGHSPRQPPSAWRRPPGDLDQILCCRYQRTVARDNTVSIPGRWAQIPPGPGRRSYQGCRVEVRELLDGRLIVFHQGRLIATTESPPHGEFTLISRHAGASRPRRRALGLDHPRVQRSPQLGPNTAADPQKASWAEQRRGITRPKTGHPWREPYPFPHGNAATGRTKSRCR